MKKEKNTAFPVGNIEAVIGYTFRDKSLITQAFTRTSFCNEANQRGESYQSNEVLEFVGDSVLSVAIITFLMRTHAERYERGIRTKLDEGDFSNIKSKLSDKKNLSECITALGLEKYLRLGEGDKKLGIENEPSVKEDLFESIIGAVYLDCNMDIPTIMGVVSRMLDVSLYAAKNTTIQSTKNALQEFCADKKRRLPQPIYKTLGEEGPDHKKIYERGVYVGDRLVASAKGKNLKLADAAAADAALKILLAEESAPKDTAPEAAKEKKAKEPRKTEPKRDEKKKAASKKAEPKSDEKKPSTKKPATKKAEASAPKPEPKKQTKVSKSEDKAAEAKPTVKTENAAKNATRGGTSAATRLKNHAMRNKVATPAFKDLGEWVDGGKTVYRVECIYMGRSAIGTGKSRPEAKDAAADKMLASVKDAKGNNKRHASKK